ncbi:MAG: 4Fe-4S dicluster domain-containing protein [Thermoplasmata archaeon]
MSVGIYFIKDEDFKDYLNSLIKKYRVYATKRVGNDVVFDYIESEHEFVDERSTLSPKDIILPAWKNLNEIEDDKEIIVFGIRSCDLSGFNIMETVLKLDIEYNKRREHIHFANFICTEPCKYGFCTTFEGVRLKEFGAQFLKYKNGYIVEIKDNIFMSNLFKEVSQEMVEFLNNYNEYFSKLMVPLNIKGIENKIKWEDEIWNELAKKCISCGACNYACPTCFCFDINENSYERIEEWDSCIMEGFTRMAGNVNPRPSLSSRLRQRFMHKLSYHYLTYGIHLCSGCGRCFEVCPVSIDIRDIIGRYNR